MNVEYLQSLHEQADGHVNWLKDGLKGYMFDRKGRFAFPGMELEIEKGRDSYSVGKDLADAINTMREKDREAFAAATIKVFRDMPLDEEVGIPIAKELLILGTLLHADGMPEAIADKISSIPNNETGMNLFYRCYEVMLDFADTKKSSVTEPLLKMVADPKFYDKQSEFMLVALADTDPANIPSYFSMLKQKLISAFQSANHFDKRKEILMTALAKRGVDPVTLKQISNELILS